MDEEVEEPIQDPVGEPPIQEPDPTPPLLRSAEESIVDNEFWKWLKTVQGMPLEYLVNQLDLAQAGFTVSSHYGDVPRIVLNERKIEYLNNEARRLMLEQGIPEQQIPEQEEEEDDDREGSGVDDSPGGQESGESNTAGGDEPGSGEDGPEQSD